jgi:hypothetical protein
MSTLGVRSPQLQQLQELISDIDQPMALAGNDEHRSTATYDRKRASVAPEKHNDGLRAHIFDNLYMSPREGAAVREDAAVRVSTEPVPSAKRVRINDAQLPPLVRV